MLLELSFDKLRTPFVGHFMLLQMNCVGDCQSNMSVVLINSIPFLCFYNCKSDMLCFYNVITDSLPFYASTIIILIVIKTTHTILQSNKQYHSISTT